MANDSTYEVKIAIASDGSGASEAEKKLFAVASATDAVGASAQKAAGAQKNLEAELNKLQIKDEVAQVKLDADPLGAKRLKGAAAEAESAADALGRRGSAAKDVYEGLTATMQGGTGVVFGLAKAWSNLTAAMAANPLAAVAAALLALKPLFDAVISRVTTLDSKLFGTGQRTAAISAGFKEIEQQSQKSMAAASAAVDQLITTFGRLLAQQKANATQLQSIKDAETDLKLAEIDRKEALDLSGAKTPAERDQIKANADKQRTLIRRPAEDEKFARAEEESLRQTNTLRTERRILEKKQTQADADAKRLADEAKVKEATGLKLLKVLPMDSDRRNEVVLEASLARKRASEAAARAKELREKNAPRLAEIGMESSRLSDDRDAMNLRRRANAKRAEGELFTNDVAIDDSRLRVNSERAIQDIASQAAKLGKQAPRAFQLERFTPNFFDDSATAERKRQGVSNRNADRRSAVSAASQGVEQAAEKLKEPGNDEGDLAALEKALSNLGKSMNAKSSQTIKNIIQRIKNIESQLKNGDRSPR